MKILTSWSKSAITICSLGFGGIGGCDFGTIGGGGPRGAGCGTVGGAAGAGGGGGADDPGIFHLETLKYRLISLKINTLKNRSKLLTLRLILEEEELKVQMELVDYY